jgi:hypothetical protein
VLGARLRLGQVTEELAEVVRARPPRVIDQLVQDPCEDAPGEHSEVLGEHAPDALEDQVRAFARIGASPFLEPLKDLGDERDRLAGQLCTILDVAGLQTTEEAERLVLRRQDVEVELRDRLVPVGARLEHLEAPERADDDVGPGLPGPAADLLPVVEGLLAMSGQVGSLARPLHLDDADARPDHVDDPRAGRILEVRDLLAVDAVAGEQLVEERLRFGPLGPRVVAPARDELAEPAPDLLAGKRHGESLEAELGLRNGEERALPQPARHVPQLLLAAHERLDQVLLGAVLAQCRDRPLGAPAGLLDVEHHRVDLEEIGLVVHVLAHLTGLCGWTETAPRSHRSRLPRPSRPEYHDFAPRSAFLAMPL